ncbi:MAG: DUF4170 domain-containing protein [Rhodospirillaceae bacterium]|nr:DUF4170 domain-containing protein [Rhodospirillaceae bacterium]
MAQRYYVIGGEYADISFTVPAPGCQLETHGPFESERDAKVCWRDLTGKTVDNAMVRYFLKEADEAAGKNYWVVGGEYADSSFTRLAAGKQLEVYGPYERAEAMGFWRAMAARSVDDAMMRYDIRKDYEAGESGGKLRGASARAVEPTATKSIAVGVTPEALIDLLSDATSWAKWATHTVKAATSKGSGTWDLETPKGPARLFIKADKATGIFDHMLNDASGHSWTVPGRVVAAGGGAVLILTFTKPPAFSASEFDADMAHVDEELAALKRLAEG